MGNQERTDDRYDNADYVTRDEPEHVQYGEYRMTTRPTSPDDEVSDNPTPAPRSERAYDPLFTPDRADELRLDWEDVQARFVEDPRRAVADADRLVGETLDEISRQFTEERESLEQQWNSGDNVDTEDLRVALQRYRSFFNRLLSV